MKRVFTLFLFFCAFHAQANDTLTRAQVYNFSVGDTFDYRIYSFSRYSGFDTSYSNTSINYTRYLITNILYSPDSLTQFIIRKLVYPTTMNLDTIVLNNLQGHEVIIDTIWYNSGWGPDTSIVYPLADYFGRRTNYITFFCCGPGWEEILFAQGLGKVIDHRWGGVHESSWNDSTILVYYANDSVALGSPYYDFPSPIYSLYNPERQISLFPTVNNGTFNLKITNGNNTDYKLIVYDLTGREVKRTALNNIINDIELPNVSTGMYLWNVTSQGKILQSGKMVVN